MHQLIYEYVPLAIWQKRALLLEFRVKCCTQYTATYANYSSKYKKIVRIRISHIPWTHLLSDFWKGMGENPRFISIFETLTENLSLAKSKSRFFDDFPYILKINLHILSHTICKVSDEIQSFRWNSMTGWNSKYCSRFRYMTNGT